MSMTSSSWIRSSRRAIHGRAVSGRPVMGTSHFRPRHGSLTSIWERCSGGLGEPPQGEPSQPFRGAWPQRHLPRPGRPVRHSRVKMGRPRPHPGWAGIHATLGRSRPLIAYSHSSSSRAWARWVATAGARRRSSSAAGSRSAACLGHWPSHTILGDTCARRKSREPPCTTMRAAMTTHIAKPMAAPSARDGDPH